MSAPSTATPVSLPAAEPDRRFYAFTIDRLIAWSIYAGAVYAAYVGLIEPGRTAAGIGAIAAVVVLVGLLSALVLGLRGTSPGKAALGLRVVSEDSGAPIGVGHALLRTLVLGVAALPTFGFGVATLAWTAVMDVGGRRRGWHDHLSHAVVVDVRPPPDVDEAAEERPRQIVNLTAMRLVPAAAQPETRVPGRAPRPATVPGQVSRPAPPAPLVAPPIGAPPTAAPPVPETVPVPVPAPLSSPARGGARRRAAPVTPPPPAPAPDPTSVTPARWRVSFDTGEEFLVEGLVLVGRRPEPRAGEPVSRLLPLRSSDMSLSKTHAQFQVVPDGALVVMDRGSTNGSVLIRSGVSRELGPGKPATLRDADTVRFGDRAMTVARES